MLYTLDALHHLRAIGILHDERHFLALIFRGRAERARSLLALRLLAPISPAIQPMFRFRAFRCFSTQRGPSRLLLFSQLCFIRCNHNLKHIWAFEQSVQSDRRLSHSLKHSELLKHFMPFQPVQPASSLPLDLATG